MPRVSVICGYYNRSELVDRTLQSILSQTERDLELVVFDDASTDRTLARIEQFADRVRDGRLKIRVHEVNRGFVRGLSEAIESTDSEYIAIQGSGDVSLPMRLERQLGVLREQPKVGVVGCWYYNVIERDSVRRLRKPDAGSASLSSLLKANVFSHGEVTMRRSTYEAAGGYRTAFRNSQDIDLWLRMIRLSTFDTVPEVLYERYVQFDGVSYRPESMSMQTRYSIAARKLATMGESESSAWLARLEEFGPSVMVTDADSALQRTHLRAAIRSAVWGATDEALSIIEAGLHPLAKRRLVATAVKAYASPVASPLRRVTRKMLGVSSGD